MSEQKRIMVIDDDPDIVTYLTMLLEDNGYATVSAADGKEGLETTRIEKPDLILLDITMPEKSGVRFYREVREDDELKVTPVIMVTGVSEEFETFISKRKNLPPPDGYIPKPVDDKKLLDKIAELLG